MQFIRDVLFAPISVWQEADGSFAAYFFAIVLIAICWVLPTAVIYFFGRYIAGRIKWYRHRQQCQHCKTWIWPSQRPHSHYSDCDDNLACCADHQIRHRAAAEQVRRCPDDGSAMRKHIYEKHGSRLVIDKCETCKLVVLDQGELKAIIAAAQEEAEDEGYDDGMLFGFVLGTVVT